MSEKEYIVTLHSHEDLESFYEDMETPGGNLYIPDRVVQVVERRPLSRNTHYMLTDDEVQLIKQDSRVLDIELTMEELGLEINPSWSQTSSYWSKSSLVTSSEMKNWGLLRCVEGSQRTNWGSDGTANVSGTITTTASGKYVDVVVVDGNMNPSHPEFSVNVNGTGGSRVVQYNWFSLTSIVTGGSNSVYSYTPYVDLANLDRTADNNHGCHVAGTIAGNTQGWARDANIYNINPYTTAASAISINYFLDYIKAWHRTKAVNSITGIKNPTIVNNSWVINSSIPVSTITTVRYRGIVYNGPFTIGQLSSYDIRVVGTNTQTSARNTSIEQDLIDLISEGIIVVHSADNSSAKIANYSSNINDDYNNYYSNGIRNYYYNRGSVASAEGVIAVGAVGFKAIEKKLEASACGPGVDIYAPGQYIMSTINTSTGFAVAVTDARNSAYVLTKASGTSVATPQVAGILACIAENNPRLKQADAQEYIERYSKMDQIVSTSGGAADATDLQGSPNRYVYMIKERAEAGQVSPKQNQGFRKSTGMLYPRTKIFRYGR